MTKEHGYLVDYSRLYSGIIKNSDIERQGFKVYFDNDSESRVFAGLLDKNKVALWNIDEKTIREVEYNE